ncbi:unnamed protein product [Dicrocoelium dendriticum]|nr:unnamed protein product [Dicrocoelium dendriticum]
MYCLSSLLAVSLVAFLIVDVSPRGLGRAVTRHYLSSLNPPVKPEENTGYPNAELWNAAHPSSNDPLGSQSSPLPSGKAGTTVPMQELPLETDPLFRFKGINLCTTEYFLPLILLGYSSLLTNGFLPAFQSYSSASYDSLTYHLAVTLSGLICALLTVVVTYVVNRRKVLQRTSNSRSFAKPMIDETDWASAAYVRRAQFLWLLMAALASCPAAYVMFLASTSPNPPQLAGLGPVLAVVAWILVRSGFSALRTWLWLHLSSRSHRPMALRFAGLATQLGALLGAIASYLMVVHFQLFKSKSFC